MGKEAVWRTEATFMQAKAMMRARTSESMWKESATRAMDLEMAPKMSSTKKKERLSDSIAISRHVFERHHARFISPSSAPATGTAALPLCSRPLPTTA